MAILAECPRCHKKQTVKNRDLRLWGGPGERKAPQESPILGSLSPAPMVSSARNLSGISLKRPGPRRGSARPKRWRTPAFWKRCRRRRMTFAELAEWYLDLSPVKKLSSYNRIKQGIANFNRIFGIRIVSSLKPLDLEDYQEQAGRGRPGPRHHRHGNILGQDHGDQSL